ncbi:MAG: 6-carboxytetrahydropterin synthase [Rhodoferax sp.]|nr:6-carboxytetrahydropterin synthase [Rhodoferax sp.]MDP3651670.1 6-carboxytetrahydropterin synthase [Rhodoferax sp.]
MTNKITFIASAPFEAARHVDVLPENHRSRRLHGHSFLATVHCSLAKDFSPYPGGEIDVIKSRLEAQIKKLDYRLLNEQIEPPTDENIARWVNLHCYIPGMETIGVQSTANEGVEIDMFGNAQVWRRYAFQSAHQLPNVSAGHKCGNMHGHGFEVIIHANHEIGTRDLSIDYDHLDTCWAPIEKDLDHACLNELPGLENPTSEMLSSWIWSRVKPTLPELSAVTVYETASCGANYDGTSYQIWKELTLDSALQFKYAPEGSKRRKIHGHTYTLRLYLSAPLDTVMGWTIDFGDVKEIFNPIFKMLDHQPLHQIPDLIDCDPASIATWILNKTRNSLPQLYRVDLFETRGCGVIVSDGTKGPSLPL